MSTQRERLKRLMKQCGCSNPSEWARDLGMATDAPGRWLRGENTPSARGYRAMATLLPYSPAQIKAFAEDDEPLPDHGRTNPDLQAFLRWLSEHAEEVIALYERDSGLSRASPAHPKANRKRA